LCTIAYITLLYQLPALFLSGGLSPIAEFMRAVNVSPSSLPSIFWFFTSDQALEIAAWTGLVLSVLFAAGFANVPSVFTIWLIYLSFVNSGQIFYGYGWETMLLETLFLSMFLVPAFRPGRFTSFAGSPRPVIMLIRWMVFRVMFGAGLIKLRGDACWRDLTCLYYHYETQPVPNPLSWYFHHLPKEFHQLSVLYNHFVELIAPWLMLFGRRLCAAAGLSIIFFHLMLIVSGNYSWLNYLTIILCISCFDDAMLSRYLISGRAPDTVLPTSRLRKLIEYGAVTVVMLLSIAPTVNLLSPRQSMNASFEPLHLVNTYGAFGSITKKRYEIVLEGTDETEISPSTIWREYEFPCKPGDVNRMPCVIAPFQLRYDWQMWFAAMGPPEASSWFFALIEKMLEGNTAVLSLFSVNPFPEKPPQFIRGIYYRYQFTDGGPQWWKRERVGLYFPPLKLSDFRTR